MTKIILPNGTIYGTSLRSAADEAHRLRMDGYIAQVTAEDTVTVLQTPWGKKL